MKVLFISFGLWEHDGRTRDLVQVCKLVGDTQYVTRVVTWKADRKSPTTLHCEPEMPESYFRFIAKESLDGESGMGSIDILFIDNRKAVIPGMLIKWLKKPRKIQDVRELMLNCGSLRQAGKLVVFLEGSIFYAVYVKSS